MNFPLTRLGPVLALALFVPYGPGCSATRDERLPSERLLSECQTDVQCGQGALCQAGTCISTDSASVIGQIQGAPASAQVSFQKVSDDEVCAMHEGQGLVCTVAPGGRVVLLAPTVPGHRFVGWTGTGCQSDHSTLELDRVERHFVCIAHYAQRLRVSGAVDGAPGLAVLVSSDSPTASCHDDVCEVDENEPVVLQAPPRDGLRPTGFTGAGCGDQAGARVIVKPVDR
ncbi:MAG: hypothetical protein JWN04_181, partial [Myxococcaceae bacterium]|nr:hypothetical protein [Myxococcaceae bacterium]